MLVLDSAPKYASSPTKAPVENVSTHMDSPATPRSSVPSSDESVCGYPEAGSKLGPQGLYAKRIVTERLANSFSAPFSSPLKPTEVTPVSFAMARHTALKQQKRPIGDSDNQRSFTMTDISALEKRKHTLQQAIKIHNAPEEEVRLRHLISQWRDAGREVTELLFDVIAKPEPSVAEEAVYLDEASTGSVDLDHRLRTEKKEESAVDWNYGTMLRTLQVDPHLLGWDEEAEDWRN